MVNRPLQVCEGCGEDLTPADFFTGEGGRIETRMVCFNIDCNWNNP